MNICCIYTTDLGTVEKPLFTQSVIPLGFASVITCIEKAKNQVELLVVHNESSDEDIIENIKSINIRIKPGLYCFTAVASQIPYVLKVAGLVKKIDKNARVLLGGTHPTLNPELCISYDHIDMVCVGEGEFAVPLLIEKLEKEEPLIDLNHIWLKNPDGSILRNPTNAWIQNIDDIPFIDRDIWREFIQDFYALPPILIGRGCPNQCTYCSNHALKEVAKGQYVRFRSPQNIIDEINDMLKKYPDIHNIYFEIETAGIHLEKIFKLCDMLSSLNASLNKKIDFRINISPNKIVLKNREKIVEKFLAANIRLINIGLESGSERIRNEILNRPQHTNEEFLEFCHYLLERGIMISIYVMVGIPTETKAEYIQTKTILEKIKPTEIQASIFHPYPGTRLYEKMQEMGFVDGKEIISPSERRVAVLSYPDFSKMEIQEAYIELTKLNQTSSSLTEENTKNRTLIYLKKWIIVQKIFSFYRKRFQKAIDNN